MYDFAAIVAQLNLTSWVYQRNPTKDRQILKNFGNLCRAYYTHEAINWFRLFNVSVLS